MTADSCKTYEVDGYTIQENGIVRRDDGYLIGRLSDLDITEEMESERRNALKTAISLIVQRIRVRKVQYCGEQSVLGIDDKHNDHPSIKGLHKQMETLKQMMEEVQ